MRYANGSTKQQQIEANKRWANKQRHMRNWIDQLAKAFGIERDQLLTDKYLQLIQQQLGV